MPQFKYAARSRTGEKTDGTLEAPDKRMALVQIERMGLVPISVSEGGALLSKKDEKGKKKKRFRLELGFHRTPKMNTREVLTLTRELADLIASGMTLGKALATLGRRNTNKAQDTIVADLRDEIIKGTSLSDALGKYPETFTTLYVSMVRAGEASGTLNEVLERLCTHFERVQEAKEKVLMALIYPTIVMVMGGATMILLMLFVVPRFSSIFAELNSTLPLSTRILIGLSSGLLRYGWLLLGGAILLILSIRKWVRTVAGRRTWHRMSLRFPVFRQIITANAFAHFARTLGALLANGVPVLSALSIVEDTVGNVMIAEEIHDARERVTDGATISGPLSEGNVFPALLTDMLAVGEETGDMSGALGHIAKRYDEELDRSVKVLTTVMEPVLMLLMAIMVGYIAISMLTAVFDMTSGLNV